MGGVSCAKKDEELIAKITALDRMGSGLIPVKIEAFPPEQVIPFDGDLDNYLNVISACGAKAVLVERLPFTEDRFLIEDPAAPKDEESMLDARDLDPEMRRFEQYLGQDLAFHVAARLNDGWMLGLTMYEPWVDEYANDSEAIEEALRVKADEQRQGLIEAQHQREQDIIGQLKALLDDPVFCSQKTQRAMKTYAPERIEGLDELEPEFVREQIALLFDKVQVTK